MRWKLLNYILRVYDENGVIYPSKYIYYSFIDENSVLIALEFNSLLKSKFNLEKFKYCHIYSNKYFATAEFNSLPTKLDIKYISYYVEKSVDKVNIQNAIQNYSVTWR